MSAENSAASSSESARADEVLQILDAFFAWREENAELFQPVSGRVQRQLREAALLGLATTRDDLFQIMAAHGQELSFTFQIFIDAAMEDLLEEDGSESSEEFS